MNQRLFIALLPPASIQEEVRQIQYDLRDRPHGSFSPDLPITLFVSVRDKMI